MIFFKERKKSALLCNLPYPGHIPEPKLQAKPCWLGCPPFGLLRNPLVSLYTLLNISILYVVCMMLPICLA